MQGNAVKRDVGKKWQEGNDEDTWQPGLHCFPTNTNTNTNLNTNTNTNINYLTAVGKN